MDLRETETTVFDGLLFMLVIDRFAFGMLLATLMHSGAVSIEQF
jgi:hypothetical protein